MEPTASLGLSLAVSLAWLIASAAFILVALYLALVTWPAIRERLRPDPNQWRHGMNPEALDRLKRALEEEEDSKP